jgi:hypothetical protein
LLILTTPEHADAHPSSETFPISWPHNTETVIVGNSGGLGQANLTSVVDFARGRINSVPNSLFTLNSGGTVGSGPVVLACSLPTSDIYVYGGILDGADDMLAEAVECAPNEVDITRARIIVDVAEDWHWGSGDPGENELDARSMMLHELVHNMGFTGHWNGLFGIDSQVPCTGDNKHTMCASLDPGTRNMRTFQMHDRHSIENAYPAS